MDCRGPVLIDVDSWARFLKETVNSIRPRASKIYPGIELTYTTCHLLYDRSIYPTVNLLVVSLT